MLSRFAIAFLPRSKRLLISWLQSPSAVILKPRKIKSVTTSISSPSLCQEVRGLDAMILVFLMLSFKPTSVLSSFTHIKRLFSSSSLSAIRVVSSAYLRLLTFLPILIPTCDSSSPAFLMMCSPSCLLLFIKIAVEVQNWFYTIEHSPFLDTQYRHCAVVGNSGILRNSRCGPEIDQADLIIRFNLSPMNFSEDVGTKTGLITINPSILQTRFKNLQTRRKLFVDALHPYGKAVFLIPAFTHLSHTDVVFRALHTMEKFSLLQQAFILNPHYLAYLSKYWEEGKLLSLRLSSGFVFVSVALEFCQHITLYGFWPFPYDLDKRSIPFHYYEKALPIPGVHSMPCEFSHYLSMHSQGVLRLRLGKCQ
uniref:Uncharacterized protein n=1 Tax=Varanus komodoensis TaxID=61221 RepID=A0A8D2IPN2_VARKO